MRSTFRVLFYTKNRAIKNGRVPIMGRITVNGTAASFSCKRDVPLALWDARGNCAKGKSEEARRLNQELENIKAQIGKHYQYLTDHDTFVSAKKVYDRYNGFGEDIHSLMEIFNIQIQDYKRQVGKTKAQSTYQGLLDEYKCLSHYLKDKLGAEDVPLMSLDVDFIKNYYNWMLSVRGLAKSTAFERVNTLKWLMYLAMDEGWIHKHPFKKFTCKPEYKKRPFLSEEDLQRVISVKLSYKRQQAIRDMFVFMCFSGLAHADLKELTYRNVHTDSDGNIWLVGNRVKTKAAYVVKLLPIAAELIERYRGVNEFKVSPDRVFPVGDVGSMESSLKRIGEKAGCSVRISPHVGRHTFATLALTKGMPLETCRKSSGTRPSSPRRSTPSWSIPKSGRTRTGCVRKSAGCSVWPTKKKGCSVKHPFFSFPYNRLSGVLPVVPVVFP